MNNGVLSNALFSFPAFTVPIGYKINAFVTNPIFFPVTRKTIYRINVRITNEKNSEITFGEEDWVLDLLIKEI